MKKHERIREKVTILPTSMYLSKMHDAGYRVVVTFSPSNKNSMKWLDDMEAFDIMPSLPGENRSV